MDIRSFGGKAGRRGKEGKTQIGKSSDGGSGTAIHDVLEQASTQPRFNPFERRETHEIEKQALGSFAQGNDNRHEIVRSNSTHRLTALPVSVINQFTFCFTSSSHHLFNNLRKEKGG